MPESPSTRTMLLRSSAAGALPTGTPVHRSGLSAFLDEARNIVQRHHIGAGRVGFEQVLAFAIGHHPRTSVRTAPGAFVWNRWHRGAADGAVSGVE